MKVMLSLTITVLLGFIVFGLSSCSVQEQQLPKPAPTPPAATAKPAPAEKGPEKVKAEKTKGDIGLLDTEKNYMILVTKEGKLLTLDFDNKTKVTEVTPTPGKIGDIGLGSSATVTYTKQNDKNVATAVEFKKAKGGD